MQRSRQRSCRGADAQLNQVVVYKIILVIWKRKNISKQAYDGGRVLFEDVESTELQIATDTFFNEI